MSVLSFVKFSLLPLAATASQVLRQATVPTNPTLLPGNWSLDGCFTDISTARTLAAANTVRSNMTVETCISFCTAAGYIFAGVEFGQECYCDSTIQIPGVKVQLSECSQPCDGNPAEICGGSGLLTVFASGQPSPQLVVAPQPDWTFQGCLTDSINNRTLAVPVNIPVGVTAETCTAACQAAGGFTRAGLEDGRECWCGNSTNPIAINVSDNDCREVCAANHNEYCGNADRIALYEFNAAGTPPPVVNCTGNIDKFTLLAVYNNPPQGFPASQPLRAILVELVPNTFWTILSACTTCCSDWPSFSLQNSVFFPRSASNPTQSMASIGPMDGESPAFVASSPPFPGTQAYCAQTPASGPSLLSFGGKSDSWALCTNTTVNNANSRVDLVFEPVTNHPHYAFSSCNAVTLQIVQG